MRMKQRPTRSCSTRKKGLLSIVLALSLALSLLAGCVPPPDGPVDSRQTESPDAPASYDDVYSVLTAAFDKQDEEYARYSNPGGSDAGDLAPLAQEIAAPTAGATDNGMGSGPQDFSQTNVQVEGIDEGDIVKTDGDNIYILSQTEIVIMQADGEKTAEIARVNIGKDMPNKDKLAYPIYPNELYIQGKTLIALYGYEIEDMREAPAEDPADDPADEPAEDDPADKATDESTDDPADDPGDESADDQAGDEAEEIDDATADSFDMDYPYYSYRSITEVITYDISDPKNPRCINTYGQDGYYISSRLQGGILYLTSSYWIYDKPQMDKKKPSTFVPTYYTGAQQELFLLQDICVLPVVDSTSYSVVTSLDVENNQWLDRKTALGNAETIYMSYGNIYLAGGVNDKVVKNSYKDGSFTVTEYEEVYSTQITKYALDKGSITYVADTTLPGSLINQFALDEYEGHLSAVTTVNTSSYRSLDDGSGELIDYMSFESSLSTNALFVLDSALERSGSIEGIAEDERVYSVRFDGAVGYFVTFKQVDPLFAVDLSDPTNPTIKSELKIPGFSTYMHVYGEGRLFGLGMEADENGATQGLKMSMFDTSDPYNITEKHVLNIGEYYSDALYDHKAIIIDPEKDLIGFPVENGYLVYGYSDEKGFYQRQDINLKSQDDEYYYSYYAKRGLYIGNHFYICAANTVEVLTLDTLDFVATIPIKIAADPYAYPIEPMPEPRAE